MNNWIIKSKDMFFYELFLKDVDGKMIDVPVMLKFLKNGNEMFFLIRF